MRSANYYGPEDLRIEDVAEPTPQAGEVKLRNAFSGICGSDLHIFFDPDHSGVDFSKPHPLNGAALPQTLGHEFSGTIVELGEGVEHFEVGDRVAVWPVYFCGECGACKQGVYYACEKVAFHGCSSHGGGMSEFTTVKGSMLHKLPDNVDLKLGALVEPMAVAWHAVKNSNISADQTALILGAGPIGIGILFALWAHGVSRVIVSEPNDERASAVRSVGADATVNPVTDDLEAVVGTFTDGRGVDYIFDAAGAARALPQALNLLGLHGTLVVVALHANGFDFNPGVLIRSETSITGSCAYDQSDFDEVLEAMASGLYQTEGWVSEVELDQVSATLRALRDGRGMKVLVRAS